MTKRKALPESPLVYWWNELLFSRYFEYETDKSLKDLAKHLQQTEHKKRGWFYGMYKESDVDLHPNNKGLDFDVQSKRRRQLDPIGITTARAHGEAMVDSATGNIKVTGVVKFGRFFHLYLLLMFLFFGTALTFMAQTEEGFAYMLFIGLTWFGMLGVYWWRMYADRQEVFEAVERAIQKKGVYEYDTSHLEDRQSDFGYDEDMLHDHEQRRNKL